jgi:hypothetical protein
VIGVVREEAYWLVGWSFGEVFCIEEICILLTLILGLGCNRGLKLLVIVF